MKNKFICIHGHFYQPPRENPWTQEVETEESAAPQHDWNERIFRECYGSNLESPILDAKGNVLKIINNYEHISFNFGPTLLSWMERRYPQEYAKLQAADAASVGQRLGHGNALAQGFNHMILPLASDRDKRTQIRWGIADFETRFHRRPEGMWLPETAVDEETLECLIEEGILYAILAPSQASHVRPLGASEPDWTEVEINSLKKTQPYRWLYPGKPDRHIDLMFYHDELSRAVAFNRILADGEKFTRSLVAAFSPDESPQLICLATDGESYGHHHAHGNMALAYAIDRLESLKSEVRLTNLGEYIQLHPPKQEVRIHSPTSWSCFHGVGRWKEDCGCNSGGHPSWNQKWRKPLRDSLNWLAKNLDAFYEKKGKGLFTDPWAARDGYVRRLESQPQLLNASTFPQMKTGFSPANIKEALELSEMQRNRLYMFTSCGWFFDEISGIEGVQILKYAARAIDLAESLGCSVGTHALEDEFISRLEAAPSNHPVYENGAEVYCHLVLPLRVPLPRMAANLGLLDHWGYKPSSSYESFDIQKTHSWRSQGTGSLSPSLASGEHLRIQNRLTLEEFEGTVIVTDLPGEEMTCRLRAGPDEETAELIARFAELISRQEREGLEILMNEKFAPTLFTLQALLPDDRRQLRGIWKNLEKIKTW